MQSTKFLNHKSYFRIKFLGKKEVGGKSGISYTDEALTYYKAIRAKKKPRVIIQVSPEVIRVVSAKDQSLLFDQAVDKISFCAPSNTHPDAFRNGNQRRVFFYWFFRELILLSFYLFSKLRFTFFPYTKQISS